MWNIIFGIVVVVIVLVLINTLTIYLEKTNLNKKLVLKDKKNGIKMTFTPNDKAEDIVKKYNKLIRKTGLIIHLQYQTKNIVK